MKLSLRNKFVGCFLFICLWTAVVAWVNLSTSAAVEQRLRGSVQNDLQAADFLASLASRLGLLRAQTLFLLIAGTPEDKVARQGQISTLEDEISGMVQTLQRALQEPAEADAIVEVANQWKSYSRGIDEQLLPASRSNRTEEMLALSTDTGEVGAAAQAMLKAMDTLQATAASAVGRRLQLATESHRRSQTAQWTMILLGMVPALGFAAYTASQITSSMTALANAAQLVAAGDLEWKVSIKSGDELEAMAESFNRITHAAKVAVAAQHDVTEQLQHESSDHRGAEGVISNERSMSATMLGLVSDAVFATDSAGKLLLLNPAAEALIGWTQTEAMGRTFDDVCCIVDERTHKPVESPLRRALESRAVPTPTNEIAVIARDGLEKAAIAKSAPVLDQEGSLIGAVVVLRAFPKSLGETQGGHPERSDTCICAAGADENLVS